MITETEAVELLKNVADGRETYETEECFYFYGDGEPACIIGHVFALVGIGFDDLEGYNQTSIKSVPPSVVQLTPEARDVLACAQRWQDSGKPWGDAVSAAIRQYHFSVER